MPHGRKPPFTLVHVSEPAFDLIADLEAAWCRFSATEAEDQTAVGNAYAALCQRRKELHEYVAGLEEQVGIRRTIRLRFD